MKTKLNTANYRHVESIIINKIEFASSYNHNYYYNSQNEDLILETTDDYQTSYYYRIENNGHSFVKNYIGLSEDQYGAGIFDRDYEGYPYRNENGEIELDDTIC